VDGTHLCITYVVHIKVCRFVFNYRCHVSWSVFKNNFFTAGNRNEYCTKEIHNIYLHLKYVSTLLDKTAAAGCFLQCVLWNRLFVTFANSCSVFLFSYNSQSSGRKYLQIFVMILSSEATIQYYHVIISWPTLTLLSPALCLEWVNGSLQTAGLCSMRQSGWQIVPASHTDSHASMNTSPTFIGHEISRLQHRLEWVCSLHCHNSLQTVL